MPVAMMAKQKATQQKLGCLELGRLELGFLGEPN